MTKKKPVILHYHIFKNAGTTIEWIFKKNFGENAVSIDDVRNSGTLISNKVLLDLLNKNKNILNQYTKVT